MVLMNVEHAILAALHDNPADEASWHALTDWLEEQTDSRRAELLRLHRGLRGSLDGPARRAAESRIQALLLEGVRPCLPTFTNSIGMELALIPAGTFWMGSPQEDADEDQKPLHEVEITRPFYLGVHLVTQEQFQRVMGSNPSRFYEVSGGDTTRLPVERITWHQAREFTEALSALPEEKAARRVYRLPTEAEWEYACRAWFSPDHVYHFGDTLTAEQANIDARNREEDEEEESDSFLEGPSVVGSYPPNAFGLYDLHGNLAEWCHDWYGFRYYSRGARRNPRGPSRGTARILRGGAWGDQPWACRTARRIQYTPDTVHDALGMRALLVWSAPRGKSRRHPLSA
jgi:uncharacterized protein (TIGR02996 family)